MNDLLLRNRTVGERIYDAFAAGDLAAITAALHDDVVLDVPGDHPQSGRWEGRDGVVAFLAAGAAVATEEIAVLDLLAGERHVAGHVVVRAERPGRPPLVNRTLHLMRLDGDGLVSSIRFHNVDQAAVDAFWR